MFAGLSDCMKAINKNEDDEADCVHAVGLTFIDIPKTALDAFISTQLVESKTQFKKNPVPLWINSVKVDATAPWTFGQGVSLLCGKKKTAGRVVWIRKAFENDDGTMTAVVQQDIV